VRDKLREQIRELRSKVSLPKSRAEELFEKFEWQIQTSSFNPESERRLMEKVKVVESQLSIHEKLEELFEKLRSTFSELQTLKDEASKVKAELSQVSERLRESIESLKEKTAAAKHAEEEARGAYEKFSRVKIEADRTHEELVKFLNKQRELKTQLKSLREGLEEEAISKVLKELEESYKQGKKKKLTLEEFKQLVSRGLI